MDEPKAPTAITEAEAERLLRDSSHELVVLPRERSDDGTAIYNDAVLDVVKELRSAGVDAAYAHDKESRSWLGEKCFTELAVSFVVGIASSGAWEGLRRLLMSRESKAPMTVKIARGTETTAGRTWEWRGYTGTGPEIARTMGEIEPPDRSDDGD